MSSPRLGFAFLVCMATTIHAQTYTGTYVTPNTAGGAVTLTMSQDTQGNVTGSLAGGGMTYVLQGLIEEGSVFGTLSSDRGNVYFFAELAGSQLAVTLFEADANNQPNYDSAQELQFTKQSESRQVNPPGQAPTPTVTPRSEPIAGGTHRTIESWNVSYQIPTGWQVSPQSVGRVTMLASNTHAGAIFVAPGSYSNFDDVAIDVTKFYQALGHQPYPVEQPAPTTIAGFQAMTALFMSQDQMGQVVQSRGVSLITPHGTGLVVIGMTTPQEMPQLRTMVDQLAASLQAQPPQTNQQLVSALAGKWMYYAGKASGSTSVTGGSSRSHEEYVAFDGVGRFEWNSSSSVNVMVPGGAAAGGASAGNDQGTYTVIGNTLIVKGQQGQQSFDIQVMPDRIIADGKTYLKTQ